MKSNLILFWALFLSISTMFASNAKNSLGEIKAENELADRIERNLSNFVERSIVFVDIDLKYNLFDPSSDKLKLDEKLSLPGLPVGKTDSSVPNIDLTDYAPTEIIKTSILVRVPENSTEELIKSLEEIIINTASLNILSGDELNISADLPTFSQDKNSLFSFRNILIFLSFLFVLIIINNIRSSTRVIAKSLRRIKISNLDQLKLGEGNDFKMFTSPSPKVEPVNSNNKPLQVRILKDDEIEEHTNLDFLNELSNSIFLSIVKK